MARSEITSFFIITRVSPFCNFFFFLKAETFFFILSCRAKKVEISLTPSLKYFGCHSKSSNVLLRSRVKTVLNFFLLNFNNLLCSQPPGALNEATRVAAA